jgi:uncharacterized protein YeeX (DUF496 family)
MGLIKEIMTLTSNVGEIKNDVDKLWNKVENHTERIIKLEQREELLAEKMSNRAIEAVYRMNAEYFNRITELEKKIHSLSSEPTKKLSE